METSTLSTSTQPAPPTRKPEVSIIADVRTSDLQEKATDWIEVRVPPSLKSAAKAKAKRENTNLSKVLCRHLEDYVAGRLIRDRPSAAARRARGIQGADLRRQQAEILNQLRDLRSVAADSKSSLSSPAIQKLLEGTEQLSRATFHLLRRHVP